MTQETGRRSGGNPREWRAPARPSRWEAKRRDWYVDAARNDIRDNARWLVFLFGFGIFGLAVLGISEVDSPVGWTALAGAAVLTVVLWGLWTAREWARIVGGVVAVLLALVGVLGVLTTRPELDFGWIQGLFHTVVWCVTAVYLLRPGAKDLFRQGRVGPPR